MTAQKYGNRQKHLNPNPLQRILLEKFHQKITELAQHTGATCVLDAGCGEGFAIEQLYQHNPALTFVGGDISVEALAWGRANLNYRASLTSFNLHHLPFPNDSFPLVVCLEVLEHLPEPVIGVQELARVSSEYVLMSTPHEPLFRGANFLRGKHVWAWGNDPEHLQNFSGRAFRSLAGNVVDIVWHGYSFPWQIALGRKRN